jgi:hypothetical protein
LIQRPGAAHLVLEHGKERMAADVVVTVVVVVAVWFQLFSINPGTSLEFDGTDAGRGHGGGNVGAKSLVVVVDTVWDLHVTKHEARQLFDFVESKTPLIEQIKGSHVKAHFAAQVEWQPVADVPPSKKMTSL